MKALIVLILLICLSGYISAQNNPIQKGNLMVGGSISMDKNTSRKYDPNIFQDGPYLNAKAFSLMPNLQLNYLILNKLSLGLTIEGILSSSKEKYNQNPDYVKFIRNDFFIGPMVRLYLFSGFFINSSAEFGVYHYDLKASPIKWNKFLFSTGFGYSAPINNSVSLEPAIRYYHQYSKAVEIASGSEKHDGFQFSMGIQIFFNLNKSSNNPTENEKN